ncbi:MAG: hypothetical protein JW880_06125 [Candidatus Thermoplasmatota archaeon]|nr:hypothetical protein [Candidatus Thermoplasmatota archaeon]
MKRSDAIERDDCRIEVLGVIKGLKSEAGAVKQVFELFRPDKMAISLSKEELDGLRQIPEDYEPELTRYEEIYAEGLSRFGEVSAPPPCYVAAVELADHFGVPIVPVDIDERTYTDLYCALVDGTSLFRHSTRTWVVRRRRFSDRNPEEFVLAWDRAVNNLDCFRRIEHERAETMAKGIMSACAGTQRLLAVIELERMAEVQRLLDDKNTE